VTGYVARLRAKAEAALVAVRLYKTRLSERAANVLQPRIGRELRSERPEIHERRRRVHVLVVLAELARMRRFPHHHGEQPR
jgi:hypothetical protein